MSLIGKTVIFTENYGSIKYKGVIVDKCTSYAHVSAELPSGLGGKITGSIPVSVDKYLIKMKSEFKLIFPTDITYIGADLD